MINSTSLESNKLWLGNLPTAMSEVQLRSIFGRYGPVERVALFPTRGYAIIFFPHKANAVAAATDLRREFKIEFEVDLESAPGFRFLPSDKELVGGYLYDRVTLRSVCYNANVIKDCDLYGNKEPWELWEAYGGDHVSEKPEYRCLYFFTRLKKKSVNGSRIDRQVGKAGTWKGEDKGTEVEVDENTKGWKKRYKYEGGPTEQQGCWYMIEYSLILPTTSDVVLCRMKKNEKVQAKNLEKKRKQDITESPTNVVPVPGPNLEHSIKKNQFQMETTQRPCFVPPLMMVAAAAPTPLKVYQPASSVETKEIEDSNFLRRFLEEERSVAGEVLDDLWSTEEETEETTEAGAGSRTNTEDCCNGIRNHALTVAPPPLPDKPPGTLEYTGAVPTGEEEVEVKRSDIFKNIDMRFSDEMIGGVSSWMGKTDETGFQDSVDEILAANVKDGFWRENHELDTSLGRHRRFDDCTADINNYFNGSTDRSREPRKRC